MFDEFQYQTLLLTSGMGKTSTTAVVRLICDRLLLANSNSVFIFIHCFHIQTTMVQILLITT